MAKARKKIIIICTTILILSTLLLLGLTYAYYRMRVIGNTADTSLSVTSKKLEVTYQNETAYIEAVGVAPGYSVAKTFEVKNTGNEKVSYSIKLENINNTFTRKSDWEFILTNKNGEILKKGIIPSSDSYILYSVEIEAGVVEMYEINFKYINQKLEDQSLDMGKLLSLRINIADEVGSIFTNASEGTLLSKIGKENIISEPLTIPGREASLDSEEVLASTEDDYGTSYYFRGNVKNNYVNYSGMCWRIVRIQGDGTIKLVLADANSVCNAETYSIENTESAYIGASVYEFYDDIPNMVFNKSDLNDYLINWISEVKLDTTKLEKTDWCNDMSVSKIDYEYEETYQNWGIDYIEHKDLYYSSYSRLSNINNAEPTLKCQMVGKENSKANVISTNIGLLTADEIVFAGSTNWYRGETWDYYLKTNAGTVEDNYLGNFWWTMTPYFYDKNSDSSYPPGAWGQIWGVSFNGNLTYAYINDLYNGMGAIGYVRPSVVLNKEVSIIENADLNNQIGTYKNPYVIAE